jgi:hypothetical protein
MLLPPKIPPEIQALQWYPLGIAYEVELLGRYVADVEAQIDRGIADYRKGTQYYERSDILDPDDSQLVPYYQDVDGSMWDLNSVFVEYFPNLQRGSAAVTLFTFFESEMNKLCFRLQKIEGAKVALKDLQGDGIERATNYLRLIVGIDVHKEKAEWSEIVGIRTFRNNWVHAAGRLPELPDGGQSAISQYVRASSFLEPADLNITIKPGFLRHVLATFDRYLQRINESLQSKYKLAPIVT